MTLFDKVWNIVSVTFSSFMVLFILTFCIWDTIQAKRLKDKARRERDRKRGH